MAPSRWPVDVFATSSLAVATALWRVRGDTVVVVIAKAQLHLGTGGTMVWAAPPELVVKDRHVEDNPLRSVHASSDLVPTRALTDVCFVGHAHPEAPASRTTVRFAVLRDAQALLDKRLEVIGDRHVAHAGQPASEPKPFERMPLGYERAVGGEAVAANPIGRREGASGPQPNLFLTGAPTHPGCFAPVSSMWAARRAKRKADAQAVRGPIFDLGDDFDTSFFQHAPPDQQLPRLRGDERLILERLIAGEPHFEGRLPSLRAAARVHSRTRAESSDVPMEIDALWIDGDKRCCTVTFRGSFSAAPGDLEHLMVQPAITSGREPFTWQTREALMTAVPAAPPGSGRTSKAPPRTDESPFTGTVMISSAKPDAAATPFSAPTDAGSPPRPVAPPPVAPPPVAPPPVAPRPVAPPPVAAPPVVPAIVPDGSATPASPWASETSTPAPSAATPTGKPATPPPTAPQPASAATHQGARPWDPAPREPRPAATKKPIPRAPAGPIDPAALPKRSRTTPAMINDSSLVAWTLPWKLHQRDTLTVIVKATCGIVAGAPAALRDEPTIPSGDVHDGDDTEASIVYPSDFAIFKPKADVVFKGAAHAPHRKATVAEVKFSFGRGGNRFSRRLTVFGPRRWKRGTTAEVPGEPKSFEQIPLTWENAYGGPANATNPVGRGAPDDPHNGVPSLEDPKRLLRTRADAPPSACFAPFAPTWPLRWSKIGSYDAAWQENRWPYFPHDFDWTHFQAAPLAQQLEHLRGDEPFSVTGVRPGGEPLSGSLPGIVPRMFVLREDRDSLRFSELALALDTVVIDGEAMTVDLVWRGVLEVSASTAPEVPALFLRVQSPGDDELTVEAAHDELSAILSAPRIPPRELRTRPPANDDGAETPHIDSVRADLLAAGIPEIWFNEDLSPAAIHPTHAELATAKQATSDAVVKGALDDLSERTAAASAGRERAVRLLETGESLDGIELSGADLAGLDFSGKSLVKAKLDDTNLRLSNFDGADLTGALLSTSDCRGTLLRGTNLTDADFVGAVLDDAELAGADLTGADFSRVRGARADFTEATGDRARFVAGHWIDARFDRVKLTHGDWSQATLHGASFEAASVPDLRLYEAEGEGVLMTGADLSGARAIGAKLRGAKLSQVKAASSVWDDTALEQSDWSHADLTDASFCGSSCKGSNFSKARMKNARLCGCALHEASFVGADLMEASFEDAKLHRSDLRGANLYGAETWNAELEGIRLAGAVVAGTKLEQR